MRFLFLSGAYKNAGDYLILNRTVSVFKKECAECHIETVQANEDLSDKLDYVNSFDYLVFPGGPGYLYDYYPRLARLTDDLDRIKPKFVSVGQGWYGVDDTNDTVYTYGFSDASKRLFERIEKDSGFLGCRDNYSVRVLKNNGFANPVLTGCPAWFDLDKVDKVTLRETIDYSFKKICVSDPANIYENGKQCEKVLGYLKNRFPNSKITFVFHRGINDEKHMDKLTRTHTVRLKEQIEKMGIDIVDISSSADGFGIYNSADLHIGYRVHAHIYNLSERNISLLIEEDGRGAGVNEALGLYRLRAYNSKKPYRQNKLIRGYRKATKLMGIGKTEKPNRFITKELDDCLFMLEQNNYTMYNNAFKVMKDTYRVMEQKIKNL